MNNSELAQYMQCDVNDLEIVSSTIILSPDEMRLREKAQEDFDKGNPFIQNIVKQFCEDMEKQGVLKKNP